MSAAIATPTTSITPVTGGASLPFSATAVVTNTRSPQTMGLEWPSPGTAMFHATFVPLVRSQVVGGAPDPTPLVDSPRNDGQLAWIATDAAITNAATTIARRTTGAYLLTPHASVEVQRQIA